MRLHTVFTRFCFFAEGILEALGPAVAEIIAREAVVYSTCTRVDAVLVKARRCCTSLDAARWASVCRRLDT